VEGRVAELGVSRKHKSVGVAHEANKLWQADLKLCEQWLKVTRKQLARQEHLIGAVELLSDALGLLGLVGRSMQGKAVVGGSGGEESDEEDGEGEDTDEGE